MCPGGPGRVRAFILFHFIPFDKNIWGMLRDPGWIFLTLVTMIPYFAARTLLQKLGVSEVVQAVQRRQPERAAKDV